MKRRWLCITWTDQDWTDVLDLEIFRKPPPDEVVLTHFVAPPKEGRWLPAKYTLVIDGTKVVLDYSSAPQVAAWNNLAPLKWDEGQLILVFTDDSFNAIKDVRWKSLNGAETSAHELESFFNLVEIKSLRGSPNFIDAVLQIVGNGVRPISPQKIRNQIKTDFPLLVDTQVRRKQVKAGLYNNLDHAVLSHVYTLVKASRKFTATTESGAYLVALSADKVDAWSDAELKASVEAYLEMRDKTWSGTQFKKVDFTRALANKFGRTTKAYEYRMRNISYVLSLQGREWISGLRPLPNVGTKTAEKIEFLLAEADGQVSLPVAGYEIGVAQARISDGEAPTGTKNPTRVAVTVMTVVRNPAIKAWVLAQAGGICECCREQAPFQTVSGEWYLEIHHVRRLADQGPDETWNAVALCPNCHRRLHYGMDASRLRAQLFESVRRLR